MCKFANIERLNNNQKMDAKRPDRLVQNIKLSLIQLQIFFLKILQNFANIKIIMKKVWMDELNKFTLNAVKKQLPLK